MYDWSAYSQKQRSDLLTDRGKWEREGANNMDYLQIEKVIGREILDSRGNPTVEAEVYLTIWQNHHKVTDVVVI